MSIATVFQISVYGVTALAGAMLAFGEGAAFPAGLTVPIAVLAFFFNERFRTLRVRALWCNLLGLGALGLAVFEFLGESLEARLLSGAHFLVYLTWIVLFQDKQIRQYWWLCALGLLQVAVGSVLTLSGWYGILLLAYLLLALWTMSIFTLYQGAWYFGALAGPGGLSADAQPAPAGASGGPAHSAAQVAEFHPPERASTCRNEIQQEAPDRWISRRFVAGVLGMSALGLLNGMVLFLLVPRVWLGGGDRLLRQADAAARKLTGSSSEVRLGHLGRILENTDRVLQVRLVDHYSERPIDLQSFAERQGLAEPLLRGNVLQHYRNGRWSRGRGSQRRRVMPSHPVREGMIRQELRLEPLGTDVLFAFRPIHLGAMADPYDLMSAGEETRVLVIGSEHHDVVEYTVFSQLADTAAPGQRGDLRFADLPSLDDFPPETRARYLQLPEEGLERLRALVEQLAAGVSSETTGISRERRLAQALENHLRESGNYTYTLDMAVSDSQIDPIEDFLFNRRMGHCEYFASALALMLRAADIPARLITGFKGADYNPDEETYEVQQRHAHAWVEAHVDGAWMVLDPTPAARDETVRNLARPGLWKSARDSLSSLWSTYVVGMSLDRQQESLFEPLKDSVSGGAGTFREAVRRLGAAFGSARSIFTSPGEFVRRGGVLALLAFVAAIGAAVHFGRRLWRRSARAQPGMLRWPHWLRRRLARWLGSPGTSATIIEFYERFVSLAASRGLERRQAQTQWEFAREVEEALADRLTRSGLDRFPTEVASSFYRARFGPNDLAESELADLKNRLTRFEQSLQLQLRTAEA